MKTIFLATLFALIIAIAEAQPASGVYLSASDFNSDKRSWAPAAHHIFRVRLNELFASSDITIVDSAGKRNIPKDSIFGYSSAGISYRLYKRESYEVLNAGAVPLLYKRTQLHGGRGAYTEVAYYFSKDAASPVMQLSRNNIRSVYSDDRAFVELVYDSLNTDGELVAYDDYHRAYTLNRLYQKLHASNL